MHNALMFDVAVIGGGVVGCAVARRFTLEGARTVLIEKAPDILAGASKGNSAILHTGFDAPADSLELACIRDGYREYRDICARLNLPLLETGAVVVAWTDDEADRLGAIEARARANGIDEVRRLDRADVLGREPLLSPGVRAGLLVPGESVIDPWSAPLAYLRQAVANGAEIRFRSEVTAGALDAEGWTLQLSDGGGLRAGTVVNCAGLFGDEVERRLLGEASFAVRPRKGQFVVFDKPAARLLRSVVLPVPTERTKGIVLAPTVFGNVLVGPTAEEQEDRTQAATDDAVLGALVDRAAAILPALAEVPVTATYAGLRPGSERKEYRVTSDPARRWITLGGIRSTGLTAALGLARHAYALYEGGGRRHAPVAQPAWPTVPNLAEHRTRDWQTENPGEIVCHCELVTRREIEAALSGPVPAGDFGGLKRRTRAGMGRCQGFYCTAALAEITRDRLSTPLALGPAHG